MIDADEAAQEEHEALGMPTSVAESENPVNGLRAGHLVSRTPVGAGWPP
jgi:hypothetical protein